MIFTAAVRDISAIDLSSIRVMISPARIPALAAGVSSIGAIIRTPAGSLVTSSPSPPKAPCVFSLISLNPLASRKLE
ncbi:hypothetical protein EVA_07581 [gut metagenome]|uniref:Uncharacterized protein n=1 Tax=gut metagenome TaxID=749906 RepID=J9GPH9_9ZZZZ